MYGCEARAAIPAEGIGPARAPTRPKQSAGAKSAASFKTPGVYRWRRTVSRRSGHHVAALIALRADAVNARRPRGTRGRSGSEEQRPRRAQRHDQRRDGRRARPQSTALLRREPTEVGCDHRSDLAAASTPIALPIATNTTHRPAPIRERHVHLSANPKRWCERPHPFKRRASIARTVR